MRILSIAILMVGLFLVSCSEKKSHDIDFNKDWKFQKVSPTSKGKNRYRKIDFDDSEWESVSLPHTANIEPLVVNNQWQGTCWYRKSFEVPSEFASKKVILELEAAMNFSKIFVNGISVANHQGGYLPVIVDLTKYLNFGKTNQISIYLNNEDNAVTGPKPLKILDFNMYGGLYRNAKLHVKERVNISHPVLAKIKDGGGIFVTYPLVSKEKAEVQIKTHINNEEDKENSIEIVHSLLYKGQVVAKTKQIEIVEAKQGKETVAKITVAAPRLWSPEEPNLYQVKTTLLVDGEVKDKQLTRIGIRKFEFRDNQLYINGEKTFLRGVNRHQEYPFVGYALSDNAQYRDAKKIKDAGFNYIRLSHYPQSPAFMRACDELGLVVADAILGWQYYLENPKFKSYCYRSAQELIWRDRNHACVLAWEVSLNETKMPIPFMQRLNQIVHEAYPGPTTYSCGWMDDVYDIYFQARQHRIMHPHELKDKPYAVSEYGDWEYYSNNAGLNQHKLSRNVRLEKSSRQFRGFGEKRLLQQANNLQEAHNDNLENTRAFGDGYWVMYDYNRGYHDEIESSGIMDIFRLPKFSYYFYQSQQDEVPVTKIASYWDKSSALDLKVYSNAEKVRLYLNGKLVEERLPDTDSNSSALSHPPFTFDMKEFTPGKLIAEGVVNGTVVSSDQVQTPLNASQLKIRIDECGKEPKSNCNDVVFAYIEVQDENGTVVPTFNSVVDVKTFGDLEIMNTDVVQAEAGIATALVRIGKSVSNLRLEASCKGLQNDRYTFQID